MQEADFYNLKTQPVPEGLLTLPLRDSSKSMRGGPSWLFLHQDFGFTEHPSNYAQAALEGDDKAKALCDKALKLFLELMELDTQPFDKLNPLNGQIEKDDQGNSRRVTRSQWRDDPAISRRVNTGNVVLSADFWFKYVKHNWLEILPNLRWFDPEPSTDPENPHTEKLIARRLAPGAPRREAALKFLKAHGMEPKPAKAEKPSKAPVGAGAAA